MAHTFVAVRICYIGDRLIAKDKAWNQKQNMWECSNATDTQLYSLYCQNLTSGAESTDPDCNYFRTNPVRLRRGIPGLPSGVFYSKLLVVIFVSLRYILLPFQLLSLLLCVCVCVCVLILSQSMTCILSRKMDVFVP